MYGTNYACSYHQGHLKAKKNYPCFMVLGMVGNVWPVKSFVLILPRQLQVEREIQ